MSEDEREQRSELLELVQAAKRLAVRIGHPVWADLADAENVLEDELRASNPTQGEEG